VLNAIERLPDELLFKSAWVSRRNLSAEENVKLTILRRELRNGAILDQTGREKISKSISGGFKRFSEDGIIEGKDRFILVGSPLTAGYWKSLVEVQREKRWSWSDGSFAEHLRRSVATAIGSGCGAVAQMEIGFGDEAKQSLDQMRNGRPVAKIDDGMEQLVSLALRCRDTGSTHVADVVFRWDLPTGKLITTNRYIEKPDKEINLDVLDAWIQLNDGVLKSNDISCKIDKTHRWQVPTDNELQRLGWIANYDIPDAFGPDLYDRAIQLFAERKVSDCSEIFQQMLSDRDHHEVRNNLAFCQIILGNYKDALENLQTAISTKEMALYVLNRGIAECLIGKKDVGAQSIEQAFNQTEEKSMSQVVYSLLLSPDCANIEVLSDVRVLFAIVANMARCGTSPEVIDASSASLSDDERQQLSKLN
jgi:hypothetical protein